MNVKELMKKLNELVTKVGVDKILHALVGALIVAQFEVFGTMLVIVSMFLVFGLSYLKERLLDETFDWWDIVFGMAGAIAEVVSFMIRTRLF